MSVRVEISYKKDRFISFDFGSIPNFGSLAVVVHRENNTNRDLCSVYAGSDYVELWDKIDDRFVDIEMITLMDFDEIKCVLLNWESILYQENELWEDAWNVLNKIFHQYIRKYGR